MTTTFHLVRHATHDQVEHVLAGRAGGVSLAAPGRLQAQQLAEYFAPLGITAVHSSPRERAQETARPIATRASVPCEEVPALDEIEFGEWTGRSFDELAREPTWHAWNSDRAHTCPPGGEAMTAVQGRLLAHLQDCWARHPTARLVLVSHGDVIKSALLHFLGSSLNAYGQIEISPAGVSTLVAGDWGGKIVSINEKVVA